MREREREKSRREKERERRERETLKWSKKMPGKENQFMTHRA